MWGPGPIEFNRAEYLVRGLGYIKNISDLEDAVVVARNNVPVRIKRCQPGAAWTGHSPGRVLINPVLKPLVG